MSDELDIKTRIMDEARERFFQLGYSKITMDDLAAGLGISKKTIYKYFRSKDDLIMNSLMNTMQGAIFTISEIMRDDQVKYLDKIKQVVMFFAGFASKISIAAIQDLQKNAPHIWVQIEELRGKYILANFRDIMMQGVKEGIIRNDIPHEIIVLMLVNSIQSIINPQVLSEMPFSAKEAFDGIINVMFTGILTEKYQI